MFTSGILLALAVLLLVHKLPRVHDAALSHPAGADVVVTVGVILLGLISLTFSGLIMGVVAGICLSFYLSIAPKVRNFGRKERVINPITNLVTHRRIQGAGAPCVNRTKPKRVRFEDLTTIEAMQARLKEQEPKPHLTYKQALKEINK
jgi:hypothetical protein